MLGCGINTGGTSKDLTPLWPELIDTLFKKVLSNMNEATSKAVSKELGDNRSNTLFPNAMDQYSQAQFIKAVLGNGYVPYIQKLIYKYRDLNRMEIFVKKMEKSIIDNGNSLQVYNEIMEYEAGFLLLVAKLASLPVTRAVITYNYDDYLECALKRLNHSYFNAFQQKRVWENDALPIYHVHGYIPGPDQIYNSELNKIVLSYDEYFGNMLNPYSWQTSTQLYYLMNYTCLFIGTSLTDLNMLRLLSFAKQYAPSNKHFIIRKSEGLEGQNEVLSSIQNEMINTNLEEYNVLSIIAGNNYSDVHKLVAELYTDLNQTEVKNGKE